MKTIEDKECKRCKISKTLEEFPKRISTVCKKCSKIKKDLIDSNRILFNEGLKICSSCEEEKMIDNFDYSSNGLNNLRNDCKLCRSNYGRTYKTNNRDLITIRARERRARKKEYYSQYDKRFRNTYHKSLKGYACKLFSGAKHRSTKKNMEFNLTSEWVLEKLTPLKCEATGFTIDIAAGGEYKTHPLQPTLDRIDSRRGYTTDNVRVTCWWWNVMKQDWTDEMIEELIKNYKQDGSIREKGN